MDMEIEDHEPLPPLEIGSDDVKPVADDVAEPSPVQNYGAPQLVSRVFNHAHNLAKDAGEDLSAFSYELRHAHKILRDLMSDANKGVNAPFMTSLNQAQLVDDMDEYREVIRRPIWLSRIREKLFGKAYETITEVVNEVRLMLENCYRYHGPDSTYTKKGLKLEQILEQKLALLPREIRDKTTLEQTYGENCEDAFGVRRRSTRHSLDYTSVILNRVRHERALRDKEQKKKHTEVKKAEKEVKEKEVIEWENSTLLAEPLRTQMKAMWELPLIGHFLFLCQTVLNIHEVSIYELERILIMPRASTLLPRVMTSLLSNPHQRVNLDRKPAMPYKIWQNRLMGRVQSWYKIRQARDNRSDLVFQQLGIEADFFQIMGKENPLLEKRFHELTFHQRVWLVKSLCDYILQSHKSIQDTMNEQTMDDLREYVLGSDSEGNAYLHFPQFCGLDLRIYRQSKTTREPAPCRWGAISIDKRKLDAGEETPDLDLDVKKSKTESPDFDLDVKKEKMESCDLDMDVNKTEAESLERIATPIPTSRSESPKPLLGALDTDSQLVPAPPLLQDESKPLDTLPSFLLCEDADICDSPPTLEDETKQPNFTEEDMSSADSKTPPILEAETIVVNISPKPSSLVDEVESPPKEQTKSRNASRRKATKARNNHLTSPVWNTRRSLRLTPARLAVLDVDYVENSSSSCSSDVESGGSDKSWKESEDELEENVDNDDDDYELMQIGDDEEPASLEPDIKKFELVVDSVEALRKLRDNFSTKLESVACGTQKERKSIKVPPKYKCDLELRDRLTNLLSELEPWEPKLLKATQRLRLKLKREWEDFNDREEEMDEDIWGSDKESVQDKSTSEDSSSDEESSVAGDEYRPSPTPMSSASRNQLLKPSTNAFNVEEDDAALLLADLGEYRTRGRVKQIRNMKLNPAVLNGARQNHNEFIRSHAKQNTVSQAKELYAWETLRQILVPTGKSTQPDIELSSNISLSLASKFSGFQPTPEKKCVSKAELDILGAINAATSMAKRQDPVTVPPKTVCVRTYDNIKKLGTSIVGPKSGITQPTSFVLHIPANRTVAQTPAINVSSVSASLTSVPQVTPSTSKFQAGDNCRLPDPARIPTKQQLSELSSIAENTESLRGILDVAKTATALKNQQASFTGTALLSFKTPDGNSVYYQLATNNAAKKDLSGASGLPTKNVPNPMLIAASTQVNRAQNPAVLQGNAGASASTGQQTVLVPVSNHQGQTVYIRVPSRSATQSPLRVVQMATVKSPPTPATVSLQPPPLEPIRRLVMPEIASSIPGSPPPLCIGTQSTRCVTPRQVCYRPTTASSNPLRPSTPRPCAAAAASPTTQIRLCPPRLVGFNTTSRNPLPRFQETPSYRHLLSRSRQNPSDLVQMAPKIPNPINIPACPVVSNNNLIRSNSASGVANLTALLSSNRTVAAAVQKLTMSGHKVVISQQTNGDVVLQASPQTPPVVSPLATRNGPSTVSTLSGEIAVGIRPQQLTSPASVSSNSPIQRADQAQKLLVNCQINATSRLATNVQLPQTPMVTPLTSTPNSVPQQVLLQTLNVTPPTTAASVQQPQSPRTSTSIKSKLIMIHDPNTKKQSFGLLLDNGQVLPVNTTLSIANNKTGDINLNPIG